MAKVEIHGNDGKSATVTKFGELLVNPSQDPVMEPSRRRPFREYFTDDGTSTGSNDMGIDGSVTSTTFYIPASETEDRYIANISIIVGYTATGQPNEWADGAAMTGEGIHFAYGQQSGVVNLHEGIKSNQDMFRMVGNPPPQTAWEVRHVNATNDYGYFTTIDLTAMMPPFGIKLDRGSDQNLHFSVRDNASAAVSFNAIAYGFDRFE